MKINKYIKKIITKTERKIININTNLNYNPIICYRGESKTFENPLQPSFFREQINNNSNDSNLLDAVMDNNIYTGDAKLNLHKAIESQHFLALSKLLDVTFNILPALYFACNNHFEEDGYIYIFTFPELFSPNSKFINNYYNSILEESISPFSSDYKLIGHIKLNERIRAQNGGFILFPHKTYIPIPESYYKKIRIKAKHKKEILKNLEAYFNIKLSTLFPEKDKQKENILHQMNNTVFYNQTDLINQDINYFIKLLELQLLHETMIENQNKLRLIRREKYELLSYFNNLEIEENHKREYKKLINDKIELLLLKYT
ncbi:FRG domain-containing protein [Macrococcoides canis]|uniref:FRG domain-containing protein n=1 Tax=Macrococcoides canis TaxID=1855823 RepID=UPI0013E95722|nr:FRG domain-containing protein [Macrococcus canis]QIH76414.1 FRG domain-containing protein [Macrococcus canis]